MCEHLGVWFWFWVFMKLDEYMNRFCALFFLPWSFSGAIWVVAYFIIYK